MSWWQLLNIKRQQEENVRREPEVRRLACPHDGTPYDVGPQGQLHCRHDGYQPDA